MFFLLRFPTEKKLFLFVNIDFRCSGFVFKKEKIVNMLEKQTVFAIFCK